LVALGFDENDERITTAVVCVYPARVADAMNSLKKLGVADKIPVASGTLLRFTSAALLQYLHQIASQ
jgi:hypothetical protein